MRLSIIIPVYNAAAWLEKCLKSAVSQKLTPDDYEIICINDGSTDNSSDIIKNFIKKFSQIKLIEQKNAGVSEARNAGINFATGDYVTFLDSDDWLAVNSLPKIISLLVEKDIDVLYATLMRVDANGKELGLIENPGEENIVDFGILHGRRTFPPTFYKRSIIGDIRFSKAIALGEDTVFNACVQSRAKRVSVFSGVYYNYLIRNNSLSKQGQSSEAYIGFMTAIETLENFRKSENMESPEEVRYFDTVIKIFITRLLDLSIIPNMDIKRYHEMVNLLKKLNKAPLLKDFEQKYKFVSGSAFLFSLSLTKNHLKTTIYNKIKK